MHIEVGLLLLAIAIVLFGGLGSLLGRWSITMPMVFVATGVILGPYGLGLLQITPQNELVKVITEATLAMLLFADASTIDFNSLRHDASLPTRLLSIGLPLTILLGAIVAFALFPAQGVAFALLVASILAPTDAALGLPIFVNPKVPVRIRRALNVESGLNDGIATPFVTLFIALVVAEESSTHGGGLISALEQIGLAVLAGVVVGAAGGKFLTFAHKRGWTSGAPLQFGVLALAFISYLGSIAIGGNGFVAAFVGGLTIGAITRQMLAEETEFTEAIGTLSSLLVWTVFGAVFVVPIAFQSLDWREVVFALLSLTVVRMVPVALALRGKQFRPDTQLLMGWFGPRGLASVVFGLLAVDELAGAGQETRLLAGIVTWTILLSVIAHGVSAQPLASWYSRRLKTASPDLPELQDAPEMRLRQSVLLSPTMHQSVSEHARPS